MQKASFGYLGTFSLIFCTVHFKNAPLIGQVWS